MPPTSKDSQEHFVARWLNQRALHTHQYPAPGSWVQPQANHPINLASGYPFPDAIPRTALVAALSNVVAMEGDAPFQYSGSQASEGLAHWIAQRMQQSGLMIPDDALLLTQGAIQGLDLICQTVLDSRSLVLVQGPTYMEALEIFHNYTDHVVALSCDRPDQDFTEVLATYLASRKGNSPLSLLYLGTSFQNPTGLVLSAEARRTLVALARQYHFLIVEDGAYDALYFDAQIPPMKTLDIEGQVLYLGTFSKTISPGLRVGWVIGPAHLVEAMARFKKDLGNPLVTALTAKFLHDEDYDTRLDWLRAQYRMRGHLATEALQRFMPEEVCWISPRGGFFIWLRYPDRVDNTRLLETATNLGVSYVPGQYFYPYASHDNPKALRICFSYETPVRITEGIRLLSRALREQIVALP